ncbi:MAG: polysaccharide biosynthesis tyrosine autokinase [Butyricicoccaceae bacterium]
MEKRQPKIDIPSIVKDILRNWYVVLLIAVSVSLFANIVLHVSYQPDYTSQTTFTVTAKGAGGNVYQNLNSAKELTTRFTQVLNSNLLKKKIAEDLGQDSFRATTSVTQIPETNLVELRVSATSPLESYRTIRSIMENYDQVTDYAIGNVVLEIIQEPSIPQSPSNPLNTRSVMMRVFALGAVLAMLLIAWLSMLRDTVKNKSDMREKIDARMLGSISHEKKRNGFKEKKTDSKVSMLISNPARSFAFVESNKMTASRIRSHMAREGKKVVMISSVMENEGKSTVAANLALALAAEGKKVLLMDCDFRKPSQYKIFDLPDYRFDLIAELEAGKPLTELAREFKSTGVYTIFNSVVHDSSERLLFSGKLKELIDAFREEMDYIILDTAPTALVSDAEDMAAQLADSVILVVREDAVPAKNINDIIDHLNWTGGRVLGCVLNDESRRLVQASGYYGYAGGYYGKK